MKKLILLFAAFMLAAGTALAAPDLSQIRDTPACSYDEFEKTWTYVQEYDTLQDSRAAEIALGFTGNDGGLTRAPFLRLKVNGRTVRSALIRVGDDVWACDQLYRGERSFSSAWYGEANSSYLLFGTGGEELLQALADADSICIRLKWNNDSLGLEFPKSDYGMDITVSGVQYRNTIGFAAKRLTESGLYATLTPEMTAQADGASPISKK